MFIGLSGPASTGKTVILNALKAPLREFAKEKGINVTCQEERVREIFTEEFSGEYESLQAMLAVDPLTFQHRLAEAFAEDAFKARSRNDLVVSDRVGLDVLVYTNVNIARGYRNLDLEKEIFENLRISMLKVDRVFLTNPLGHIEEDGFRPSQYADPAMRAYEENLFRVLGGTYPNTIWLPAGHDERINLIMTTIKGYYS